MFRKHCIKIWGSDDDVCSRVKIAAFIQLHHILRSSEISLEQSLEYSTATWKQCCCMDEKPGRWQNQSQNSDLCQAMLKNTVKSVLAKCYRQWRVVESCNGKPVDLQVKARKWRWSQTAVERQSLKWNPQRQRRKENDCSLVGRRWTGDKSRRKTWRDVKAIAAESAGDASSKP